MDWTIGKSYYIGFTSIDRFETIVFFHNYLCTWAMGVIFSFLLPLLFVFAPASLRTTRTSHFLLICLVCLSNMSCLYVQPFMLGGTGEPNLAFHTCRFLVYLSTFAKPIGLYCTLLFSIERIFTKILSKMILSSNHYRLAFKKMYPIFIFLGVSLILSIKLYEILQYIPKPVVASVSAIQDDENSTDRRLNFQYCYRSISTETYTKILFFYVVQSWFEHLTLAIIILCLLCVIMYQYLLPRFQQRPANHLSVNTKFYLSLSSCVLLFEYIFLFLHSTIHNVNNNNSDTQVNYLRTMLFAYNVRCIVLPVLICLTMCDPLKTCLSDLLLQHSYLERVNEDDQTNASIDRSETFSSFQRTFAKNQNNEHFDS